MDARPLRWVLLISTLILIAPFFPGCGSSSINVDAPSGAKCQVSASSSLSSVPASGGTGTITVTTTRDCTWTATTATAWIALSSTSGQGGGSIDFRVAANAERSARRGAVVVNDSQITIDQAPAPCTYSVSPVNSSIGAAGGAVTVQVTAGSGCTWTTASNAEWLTVSGGGTASGPTTITVAPNTGSPRTGTVTIAGQTVTIAQGDGTVTCTVSLGATTQTVPPAGGAIVIPVSTPGGCHWTAASSAPWVTIVSGASGTGPGEVQASVDANPATSDRQATIAIGASVFTVVQTAAPPVPCSFAIAPQNFSAAASGGTTNVSVTAASTCAWSATSRVDWITVTSGASGAGNGAVGLRVATNSGGQRSGTVVIAGQTFTVTQAAAACAFTIAPTNTSVPAAGATGTVTVTVTAGANCGWTSSSNTAWITVTTGGSGTGNGSVGYSVAANTGPARSGTLSIAGQTFTIAQAAAPCAFTIAPTSQSVPAGGGAVSATVTTDGACAWTSTSNSPWITISSGGSGTGNGTVALAVAANAGAARTGTVTIAGQTLTIAQDAAPAPCTFTIAPTSQSIPAAGGNVSVNVTSGAGCAWTATSNAAWIAVASGASGTGNGIVALTIAANGGAARTGTVTIGGQTFTVSQDAAPAPCSFAIAPTSQSVPASGGSVSVNVTAGTGCAWTATSNAPWITVGSGAPGAGNGTVALSVAANGTTPRSGTVTIAGQTFTVAQDAAPCTFSLAPPGQLFDVPGGSGSFTITTDAACAWTATSSNPDWLVITSAAAGTGPATVNFTVSANTGAARAGSINVSGQVFAVGQTGAVH